jgi:hypothetical protein
MRDVGRGAVEFSLLAHFCVVHAGPMKEVRVGWTGLSGRYANVGVLQLVANTLGERQKMLSLLRKPLHAELPFRKRLMR